MTRRTAAAGAVLTVLALLSGCADEREEYCEALAEEKATLNELAESSVDGGDVLTPTLESFEALRAVAPEELQDEWETLVVAYEAVVDAVERAKGRAAGNVSPQLVTAELLREMAGAFR